MTQQLNKKYCREYANLPFNLFLKAFGNKKMIQEQRMPSCLTINKQCNTFTIYMHDPCSLNLRSAAAAAAKSLQSCPTLCDPIDSSPPGSSVPGILQARTLEWVAISFSNAWKWKVKVKSLSHVRILAPPWTAAYQAPPSMGFSRQEYWSGVPLPSPFSRLTYFTLIFIFVSNLFPNQT